MVRQMQAVATGRTTTIQEMNLLSKFQCAGNAYAELHFYLEQK